MLKSILDGSFLLCEGHLTPTLPIGEGEGCGAYSHSDLVGVEYGVIKTNKHSCLSSQGTRN